MRPGSGEMKKKLRPNALNRICAYPVAISWLIGAGVLNFILLSHSAKGVPFVRLFLDWPGVIYLLLAVVATTGFGYFVAMFTCWPWVRPLCCWINGAPLQAGDTVVMLSGPLRGAQAQVYELTKGQGGWKLARLDLGSELRRKYSDMFDEYAVFKIEGETSSRFEEPVGQSL
jgi:hypothetical protein